MTSLVQRLQPPTIASYPGTHLGLRWRPVVASDGPEIAALAREVEDYEDAFHRLTNADIADMMEGEHGVDRVDAVVGVDSQGRVCAVASVRVLRGIPGEAVAQLKAMVHPDWRGRGLGRALLFWQEARARQLLVEEFGEDTEIPTQIMNIVDAHMTDRRRLYIAAGFYAKRTFSIMYRDIEGGETYPEPREGYRLLAWKDTDEREIRQLHMDVFTHHFWPEMRERWWDEAMENRDDRWSMTIQAPDGSIAAYCIVGRPSERWVVTGRPEAYIELLGVSPEHRGKGLVRTLIGHAVAAAAASGIQRIGLDVDTHSLSNAKEIYEHLGFIDYRAEVYYCIDYS